MGIHLFDDSVENPQIDIYHHGKQWLAWRGMGFTFGRDGKRQDQVIVGIVVIDPVIQLDPFGTLGHNDDAFIIHQGLPGFAHARERRHGIDCHGIGSNIANRVFRARIFYFIPGNRDIKSDIKQD